MWAMQRVCTDVQQAWEEGVREPALQKDLPNVVKIKRKLGFHWE